MDTLVKAHPAALAKQERFHADVVAEVAATVAREKVVVVGMGWNPHVGKARRWLDARKVPYTYLGYGNYVVGWKRRLAIKMWSHWPTFPQVFVNGALIGGASDLARLGQTGEWERVYGGAPA